MAAKTEFLQIRVTPEEKALLRRLSEQAGQDMSRYVLGRILPDESARFVAALRALQHDEDHRFAIAEIDDLLAGLDPRRIPELIGPLRPDLEPLLPLRRNLVAAMVEEVCVQHGVPVPRWVRDIPPLEEPYFSTDLRGLRLHLIRSAPPPYKRRNIFVDTSVGGRV